MNQDAYYFQVDGKSAVLLVCDGMGGAKAGDIASRLAVSRFVAELNHPAPSVDELLERAVSAANDEVYYHALQHPECCGMGTTLVGGVVADDCAHIVNVGDSRCYYISQEGIEQVTEDHSLVADMVRRGMLTPEQAKIHPRRNLITRALGTHEELQCDLFHVTMESGSMLLLCSDGLSNLVSEQELLYETMHGADQDSCCQRLIQMALDRGAPDNVTIVLFQADGRLN